MKIISVFFLFFLISCKENKTETQKENNEFQTTVKAGTKRIHELERLAFRRSYAGHETLSGKELKKLYSANPTLLNQDTSKLIKKLNQTGLMEQQDLVLSKFDGKKIKKAFLDDKNKIDITCDYYPMQNFEIKIVVNDGIERVVETVDLTATHLIGVILKDIDGDNIKEILIVTVGYIMNGDNFDLQILKYD